jgi:CRISPR system Cascade subunit CasD
MEPANLPNTLFLRLESPMQSWGEDSQWSERRTAPEPTKSGVVGLLTCALGWSDDDRIGDLSHRVRVGVRCDLRGTTAPLRDYHTVGGGYAEPQLLTAEGKPKWVASTRSPHTEPTWRYYLCDASFLVAIQSDPQTVQQLALAVQFPVWVPFLGRKCCVPSRPLFDGLAHFDSLDTALAQHPVRLLKGDDTERLEPQPRIILECSAAEGVRRRDQIVSRAYRIFEPRYSHEDRLGKSVRIEYLDEGA